MSACADGSCRIRPSAPGRTPGRQTPPVCTRLHRARTHRRILAPPRGACPYRTRRRRPTSRFRCREFIRRAGAAGARTLPRAPCPRPASIHPDGTPLPHTALAPTGPVGEGRHHVSGAANSFARRGLPGAQTFPRFPVLPHPRFPVLPHPHDLNPNLSRIFPIISRSESRPSRPPLSRELNLSARSSVRVARTTRLAASAYRQRTKRLTGGGR